MSMTTQQIENALCDQWQEWCESQGLECVSADEMDCTDLSDEQRTYIAAFIVMWEDIFREM